MLLALGRMAGVTFGMREEQLRAEMARSARSAWSSFRKSEKVSKFFRGQACVFGDRAHGERIDRVVAGNGEPNPTVAHHDVTGLAGNPEAEFLEDSHGIFLADSGQLGRQIAISNSSVLLIPASSTSTASQSVMESRIA